MGKSSLIPIVKDYLRTLHSGSSEQLCVKDIAFQIGLPVFIGICAYVQPFIGLCGIRSLFTNGIVAISIVSSLLCGLAVMIFQLRLQISMENSRFNTTNREKQLIDELFSDVLWAVVSGFTTVLLMTISNISNYEGIVCDILTAASLSFSLNFILVTCMCLKRLNTAYAIVSKSWPRDH